MDCSHFLVPLNNAAVNMGIQISFETLFSILFWYIPRSGIAGSYGNSVFNFLRNHQTVFYSSCTTSHSHLSVQGFQFLHILDSLIIFFFFFFLIVTILVNVWWYLSMVLICISLMMRRLNNFSVHIGHLYIFFGTMSVHICPFFTEVVFAVVEL